MTTAVDIDISPEHIEKMAACTPFITPEAGAAETAAALRALRSALTDAQEIARRGDDIILELEKKLDVARSSLTASEKDAARYRWLRGDSNYLLRFPAGVEMRPDFDLDAAIDAAMEKANGDPLKPALEAMYGSKDV